MTKKEVLILIVQLVLMMLIVYAFVYLPYFRQSDINIETQITGVIISLLGILGVIGVFWKRKAGFYFSLLLLYMGLFTSLMAIAVSLNDLRTGLISGLIGLGLLYIISSFNSNDLKKTYGLSRSAFMPNLLLAVSALVIISCVLLMFAKD